MTAGGEPNLQTKVRRCQDHHKKLMSGWKATNPSPMNQTSQSKTLYKWRSTAVNIIQKWRIFHSHVWLRKGYPNSRPHAWRPKKKTGESPWQMVPTWQRSYYTPIIFTLYIYVYLYYTYINICVCKYMYLLYRYILYIPWCNHVWSLTSGND